MECYTFVKYRLDGDKLVMWTINEPAKGTAIKSGKIKGIKTGKLDMEDLYRFTDTTENVAHFVANAPDSLWDKLPGQFERVKMVTKRQTGAPVNSGITTSVTQERAIKIAEGRSQGRR